MTAKSESGKAPKIDPRAKEFGLTPAETRVAELIAEGLGATAVSRKLRRSHETVRAQLKTIYDKTGAAGKARSPCSSCARGMTNDDSPSLRDHADRDHHGFDHKNCPRSDVFTRAAGS